MMSNRVAGRLALLTAAVIVCGCAPRIRYDFSLGNTTAVQGATGPAPSLTAPGYVAVPPNTTAAPTRFQLRRDVDRSKTPEAKRLRKAVARLQRDVVRMQEDLDRRERRREEATPTMTAPDRSGKDEGRSDPPGGDRPGE